MKKDVWMIIEHGNDAKDNAYVFFAYLRLRHPEIKAYYVADIKHLHDYKKVKRFGNVVQLNSFRHKILYICADKIITTHNASYAREWKFMKLKQFIDGIKKKKMVFLQHGVILNDLRFELSKSASKIDLFICGAQPEYLEILRNYGYAKNEVVYTGLARFDLLHGKESEDMILIMPSWRRELFVSNYLKDTKDKQNFMESNYYKTYQSLLDNTLLQEQLEKRNYKLVFYLHYNMQKYSDCFSSNHKNILVMNKDTADVQELLIKARLVVTDYSSISNDVAYMEKPLIYYQFDKNSYRQLQYKEGYFSYERDGCGAVVESEEDLLKQLIKYFDNNMQNDKLYIDRSRKFFVKKDRKNCARIYKAICKME